MTRPSRRPTAFYTQRETAMGPMLIAGNGRRLIAVKFGVDARRVPEALDALDRELHSKYALERDDFATAPLADQICAYLDGARTDFDVELDLSWVTPFRRDVLLETQRVPRGQVASYAEIARRVGRPTAYRAVGNTMRTNPIPIVIPCHRIVGSNGPGGFGGGMDMKQRLLALEGATLG